MRLLRPILSGCCQAELLRQTTTLQFARRAFRDVLDDEHLTRDLKSSQARCDELAYVTGVADSILMQHHGRSDILAQSGMGHGKGHRLGHGRMLHEHVVHFLWGNFFPATVDDLLEAASDEQIAIGIQKPLVTRPEPAMRKGLLLAAGSLS